MKQYIIRLLPDMVIHKSNQVLKKEYPIQDEQWPSRRFKENGSYVDLSGGGNKLYLLSSEFEKGEEVVCFDSETFDFVGLGIAEELYPLPLHAAYRSVWGFSEEVNYQFLAGKIIAEVSSNAIWAKDEDFKSSDQISCDFDGNPLIYAGKVKIKCYCCDRFA
jgi:hypothetical protein